MISIFIIRMLPINLAKLKIYMKVHNIYHKICNQNKKKVRFMVFYLLKWPESNAPLLLSIEKYFFVFAVV